MNVFVVILLTAIIGGGVPVLSKIGLKEFPPLTFILLRFISSTLILFPLFLREKQPINRKIIPVVLVSLFAVGNVVLFSFGIRLTSATISQMLYASVPLFAAVLSFFLLKQKLGINKIVGIFFGFIGVMIIILLPLLNQATALGGSLLGNLIVFSAVLSFSLYTVLSKKVQGSYSSTFMVFVFAFLTICMQAITAFFELQQNSQWWTNVTPAGIFSLLYVGIFGTAIYYILYQYMIKKGSPVIASMILYLQPIATYIWAFILLRERLTPGFAIGALLSFTGAWLVTRKK